jgi:hypothetical protein
MIRWYLLFATVALGLLSFMPSETRAAMCANGVYNAGCVGPNGAAVVHKSPPVYARPPPYAHPPSTVTCANGVYRAGCAGPNGAAVIHKSY